MIGRARASAFATWSAIVLASGCDEQASGSTKDEPAEAEAHDAGTRSKQAGQANEQLAPLEIVTDEVVRTKDGHALLALPPPSTGWSVVHKAGGGVRGVQLFRGTPTDFTGFISVVFLPSSASGHTPEAAHEQFTAMMKSGMPGMTSSGEPQPFQGAGSLANTWSGTSATGVAERVWLGVVTNGPAAAGVMVRGAAQVLEPELMPMAKQVIANLLLGAKVPHLPDNTPSVKLSGLWEYKSGLRIDWLTFDPRGHAHMHAPSDPSWLDLDVCLGLGRQLRSYSIANGEITLVPYKPDPSATVYKWKFEQKGASILIDGQEYRRIDQAPVTIQPGTWEYYEASSGGGSFSADEAVFEFAADGTYTYSGGFTFMHDRAVADDPSTIEWSVSGYAGEAPAKGKWRVEAHTLILDDGQHQVARSLFASQHSEKIIYIGGQRFVKMK